MHVDSNDHAKLEPILILTLLDVIIMPGEANPGKSGPRHDSGINRYWLDACQDMHRTYVESIVNMISRAMGRSVSQAARQTALLCIFPPQLFLMRSTSRNQRLLLHFPTSRTLWIIARKFGY